jgi:hypothetical protein
MFLFGALRKDSPASISDLLLSIAFSGFDGVAVDDEVVEEERSEAVNNELNDPSRIIEFRFVSEI